MAKQEEKAKSFKVGTREEPVRFSYAFVHEPRPDDQGKLQYSVCILIPKSYEKQIAAIQAEIQKAVDKGKADKWGGKVPFFKTPTLHDGDVEKADKPEYEGMMYLNAKNTRRPTIVDSDRQEIMDENDFYSGCWGRVAVDFFPYANKQNGVACSLGNLQKFKDDVAFSGGRSAAEDFGDDEDGLD